MTGQGAYGRTLANAMNVRSAASFVNQTTLRAARIAVTEIRSSLAEETETSPVGIEDAILVMAQMRDWPKRVLFEDGRSRNVAPLKSDAVTLFDLRKVWTGVRSTPVHYICFYLPRAALVEIGDIEGMRVADEFPSDYCEGKLDLTMASLARSLLPAFERPQEANHLFVDHITAAAAAHVLRQYGTGKAVDSSKALRLSAGHRTAAEEMIDAHLDGEISVSELASECGMTATDFVAAFRLSTGLPPHRWLLHRRIERSMELLKTTRLPVGEIAAAVGFSSSGHFNRVFREVNRLTPVTWRKLVQH